MKSTRALASLALAIAGLLLAQAALAAPYVILKDGVTRREGTRIRADKDGTIILTTAQGNIPFPRGQYAKAVMDEPPEFKPAAAAVAAGKIDDKVISTLEKIVSDCRYLNWDVEAQKLLAEALLKKGDAAGADAAYKKLYTFDPELQKNTDISWAHRRAMLAAKQYATLQKSLDAVAAAGPRTEAQNRLEEAAMDYLRTAILFADVKDAEILGEATFKAAQVLEQLRDSRAKEMYRKCAEEYRSSSYAAKARNKI